MTPSLEERALADLHAVDPEAERLASLVGFTADMGAEDKRSFADVLADETSQDWTDEEFNEALTPYPHVFSEGHVGLFPVGEVTILAGAGREGKTTAAVGVCTGLVLNLSLGGLWPLEGRRAIIYSGEDDRPQYARKVGAQHSMVQGEAALKIKQRLRVPNLDGELRHMRSLVMLLQGQPEATAAIDIIIEAFGPMMRGPNPPGLLIFETASTLSEAEETNPAFRVLIMGLRRIARELGVAVVLSHHVSQASLVNLPALDVSTADIRGGTVLVNNARQCGMLVNLGSDDEPFPEADARTVLRLMAAPGVRQRVTALITLDSSKGIDPPPLFFRWESTPHGPAAVAIDVPAHIAGKPWRKVHSMIKAERAGMRETAKAEEKQSKQQESISLVVSAVRRLSAMGQQPTANKVSIECNRSPTWATPHLTAAVGVGLLKCADENVPRVKGPQLVYRPADSTESIGGGVE